MLYSLLPETRDANVSGEPDRPEQAHAEVQGFPVRAAAVTS